MSTKLKVDYVPIDKLQLNPRNPRIAPTSAILALKKSIEEFGWTNPVLVQKSSNIVIAGHQRIKAAKLAGLSEIPVIFLDFDDTKSLAYNIADNKLAELTDWDQRELILGLESLNKDLDLTLLGFNKEELEQLVPDLAVDIISFEEELAGETTDIISPLPWFGGKSHLAPWVISHFPEHHCYVEPFGGSAAVLLRKQPSEVEIYNDINRFIFDFFKCLRDNPTHLLSSLVFLPYSRQLFEELKTAADKEEWPDDIISRSAAWFYLQRSSFSGIYGSGWRHAKTRNIASTFTRLIPRLFNIAARLKNVQFENKDFREIFKLYDAEDTLFYVDPPYLGVEDRYQSSNFTMEDHKDLARTLHTIRGKACVSYYPHPFVDKIYRDWRRVERTVYAWSHGITVNNPTVHKPTRTELLLMNY